MKKNIIFVIPTLRMGGAEKSLISLLKLLDPDKVRVDLFLFEADGVLQPDVPNWINIVEADPVTRGMTLEIRNFLGDVIKARQLTAAVARVGITLASRFGKKSGFSWNKIKNYIPSIAKKYDVAIGYLEGFTDFFVIDKITANKKIGWIHSDFSGRVLMQEEKDYYNKFDNLITISEVCKNAFVSAVPKVASKTTVLENIVLTDEVIKKAEKNLRCEWDRKICNIVSVGRLEYAKGIDIGAEACKILLERGIQICWHVYGTGSMKADIEEYIKNNALHGKYVLEGQVSNPYPYMKNADIIVQPSRWEGKSVVLDEAKILGKAIVVTDYPSATDQISNGVTGLITGKEPELVADGIETLINNPLLRTQLEMNSAGEENSSYKTLDMFNQLIDI